MNINYVAIVGSCTLTGQSDFHECFHVVDDGNRIGDIFDIDGWLRSDAVHVDFVSFERRYVCIELFLYFRGLVFVIFEGKIGLFPQKAVYLLINLAVLAYLFNHAANMGLFPIHSGDWVASFPASTIPETAVRAP